MSGIDKLFILLYDFISCSLKSEPSLLKFSVCRKGMRSHKPNTETRGMKVMNSNAPNANVDIDRMVQCMGGFRSDLRRILFEGNKSLFMNQLKCASTFDEVWAIYNIVPSGSKIEVKALQKALELASSFNEVWAVYKNALTDEIREAALEKGLALASTIDEVQEVHQLTLWGSKIRLLALQKFEELLPLQLERASTFDEVWAIYQIASGVSTVSEDVLQKAFELMSTFDEAQKVCSGAPNGSRIKASALQEIEERFFRELECASSVSEVLAIQEKAKVSSDRVRVAATEKAVELISTFDEAMEVYSSVPIGSEAGESALKKGFELISSARDALKMYERVSYRDELGKAVLWKMATFFPRASGSNEHYGAKIMF